MNITRQKYNSWKIDKKLWEWGEYESYYKSCSILLIHRGLKIEKQKFLKNEQ